MSDLETRLALIRAASNDTVPPGNLAMSRDGVEYRGTRAELWAEYAGLSAPAAVIAWTIASEALSMYEYPAYGYAIGEAVLNAGWQMAIHDRRSALNGYFAHQSGRWCSTWHPPTWKHVTCARMILDSSNHPDLLAHGATLWIDPKSQVFMNSRKPATNPTPEEVVRRRYKAGYKWVGPDTHYLDPFRLLLFGRDGVSLKECLDAVADGRKRWRL